MMNFDPPGVRMFAARVCQMLFGLLLTGFSLFLGYYVDIGPRVLASYATICGVGVLAAGCVGMFAFQRPRDVHWHLTISFDWIALVASLYSFIIYMLYLPGVWLPDELYAASMIVASISAIISPLAVLYSIIGTYRLKKQGKLPSRNPSEWVHMENQDPLKP